MKIAPYAIAAAALLTATAASAQNRQTAPIAASKNAGRLRARARSSRRTGSTSISSTKPASLPAPGPIHFCADKPDLGR